MATSCAPFDGVRTAVGRWDPSRSHGLWIWEYNHDRPHHGVGNRTPREALQSFGSDLNQQALTASMRRAQHKTL